MGRPKHESGKHLAALELYIALGRDRSLSEVARRFHTTPQAVSGWSAAFSWQKRVAEREKIVSELVAQKAVEDEAQSRADALKITRAAIFRFAAALQPVKDPVTGKVVYPATVQIGAGDFVNLVKLEQFLRGKPSERSELMIGGQAFEKLIDAIAAVIEREVADEGLRGRIATGIQDAAAALGHA